MYRYTVDDPETWTKPWSAEIPMMATGGPLFEYACHEGNYGMRNTLSGARANDNAPPAQRPAAPRAPAPQPTRR